MAVRFNSLFLFYIVIVLIQFISLTTCDPCTTPTGEKGECKNVELCPALLSILITAQPQDIGVSLMLMSLKCGEGEQLKVCCVAAPARNGGTSTTSSGPDPAQPGYYSEAPPAVEDHPSIRLLPTDCGVANNLESPWLARLVYRTASDGETLKCTGSIINEKYVLTAAHCALNMGSIIGVKVGKPDAVQQIATEKFILHPNYIGVKLQDDVALLRLASPLDFSKANIKPICLPLLKTQREKPLNNVELSITRWNITQGATSEPHLLKEKLSYVPNNLCGQLFNTTMVEDGVGFRQMCAGGMEGNACGEDAGGPLETLETLNGHQRFVQYGTVSFGPSECIPSAVPTVHARVPHYVKWILDTINP